MASNQQSSEKGGFAGLNGLDALPPDPLLGLMTAFRSDRRDQKIDLGVGVYKDASGATPIMSAVRKAEEALLTSTTTKAYEGPRGNATFCEEVTKLIYGAEAIDEDKRETLDAFATPGGCGSLNVAASFLKRLSPTGRLWVSAPSWPNHNKLARFVGFDVKTYPYGRSDDGALDLAAMEAAFDGAKPGDGVIVQGPCHNPTGVDLSPEQWTRLAERFAKGGVFPIIDAAYQGFGDGLEEDMQGIRAFLQAAPEAIVTYSCSKNFGLYRDRCGCLILQAQNAAAREAAGTHLADIARSIYSMPPAHGPAIVATILTDPALAEEWREELNAMRERMTDLRGTFANALTARGKPEAAEGVLREKGMFSMMPLKDGAPARLRETHGLYMPGSGRINIAGLTEDTIEIAADAIAPEIA